MNIKKFILIYIIGLLLVPALRAQENVTFLSGKVQNEKGIPLRNVKITLEGDDQISTYTDQEGSFSLAAKEGDRVTANWKDERSKTVVVGNVKESLNIHLGESSVLISTDYGKKRRREEISFASETINSEVIDKVTVMNPSNALYGQLPGLWVLQNPGFPTQRGASLQVRGQSTLNDNSILVLVDGFERDISTLTPEEISSITVLKDAAAKGLYGMKGANGVLLITTKTGTYREETTYSVSYDAGITQPVRVPEFVNAAAYAKAYNEGLRNDGLDPRYSDQDIANFESQQHPGLWPDVNWVDQALSNQGNFQRFNFGAKGGKENTNYFLNLNYHNEKGFYKHTDAYDDFSTQLDVDQLNLRTNLQSKITPTTVARFNIGASLKYINQPGNGNIIPAAYSLPANAFPVKNIDGSWGGNNFFGNRNPVARLQNTGYSLTHTRDFNLNVSLEQDMSSILKGLNADLIIGYDNGANFYEDETQGFTYASFVPVIDSDGAILDTVVTVFDDGTELGGSRSSGNYHQTRRNFMGRLNYEKYSGNNSLNASLFYHQEYQRLGVNNQTYLWQNIAGNIHYGIDGKYFLDATLAYQGTNRIQKQEDRWGLFPTVSAAWLISEEDFLSGSSTINTLKLRGSWGKVGNGLIPIQNLTSPRYGEIGGYRFGDNNVGVGGYGQLSLGIPFKTYESSYESNIGFEAGFLKSLFLTGDVFYQKRKNILVTSDGTVSGVLGISAGLLPEGIVETRGMEINAGLQEQIGDFSYFVNAMASYSKNKVINQNEPFRPEDYLKREGKSMSQPFGLESGGFFQDEADIENSILQAFGEVVPGDIKYIDQNADGIINEFDLIPLGKPRFPELYYSGSLGVGFKGIELSATFQGAGNHSVMLNGSHVFWPLRNQDNLSTWYTNYWSQENKNDAELPRLTTEDNPNNFRTNDIWLRNGAFLKLRYVQLSFALHDLIPGLTEYLNETVLYVRGRNVKTWDNIKYVDPEAVNASYPTISAFNIGLKVQF
jgi:TonB-linked SusC/RagA family outer membrane protein